MIKIGNTVHYRSRGSADGVFPPECRAAIVTEIGPDVVLSLAIINPTGLFFDGGIPISEDPAPGTWHTIESCPD